MKSLLFPNRRWLIFSGYGLGLHYDFKGRHPIFWNPLEGPDFPFYFFLEFHKSLLNLPALHPTLQTSPTLEQPPHDLITPQP